MLINNLQEAIVDNINDQIDADFKKTKPNFFIYNKKHILIKFLDKDSDVGLVPSPGSHMVESDMAGEEYWQYNYSITIRTKSRAEAHNKLFEISQYLQMLNQSKNLSDGKSDSLWTFDKIEVPNEPSEIQEDIQGTVMYSMDVAVFVYKNKGVL